MINLDHSRSNFQNQGSDQPSLSHREEDWALKQSQRSASKENKTTTEAGFWVDTQEYLPSFALISPDPACFKHMLNLLILFFMR